MSTCEDRWTSSSGGGEVGRGGGPVESFLTAESGGGGRLGNGGRLNVGRADLIEVGDVGGRPSIGSGETERAVGRPSTVPAKVSEETRWPFRPPREPAGGGALRKS